jgi:hypothetical protein
MRGFYILERGESIRLSGKMKKPNPEKRDEVFVSPLVGVSG